MSDQEDEGGPKEYKFYADRAKTGRAGCKKCKQKIDAGLLRMAKAVPNNFSTSGGFLKAWHHVDCIFEVFAKQRATTAKIEYVDDIGGWDLLSKEDQDEILSRLPESARGRREPGPDPSTSGAASPKRKGPKKKGSASEESPPAEENKDNSLREFRRLCADIANVPGYLDKTNIVRNFITYGTDKVSYTGDLHLLVRLLLPGVVKRIYNLQSKQIIKLFSRILGQDQDEMLESLEQGDVAETIRIFFESNTCIAPAKKSKLTIHDVDRFLEHLSKLTKEEDQMNHFMFIAPKCTGNDLKIIIRLIKHDLRINAGAKHILDAVHADAYEAFQASRDINSIISKVTGKTNSASTVKSEGIDVGISLLTPILPMLAQACKSVDEAMSKCSNGMYSEVKYDGERVQVHKKGNDFKFYSRSLKPVLPHKVKTLQEFIPKAFPHGRDLILDSEILLIDNNTGKPLPFGSLGIHKKSEFRDANVCLFVFDCIYYNGESLLQKPLKERRKVMHENMTEIPNRIVFSEMEEIHDPKDLAAMITKVIRLGLEGLVLKDIMSIYEPGKRHWLKVKKDYLSDGAMADSADLVVLGAWYGTGQKGGMMSVFLMGCYDKNRQIWCTVTKVHTGHDDSTLERLQTELDMVKISKDQSKVPKWLKCTKTMVPDFVARDPKAQPVWEIVGAELTKNVVHTADGISVRFPRVKRIRSDKDWTTATALEELREIYRKSKDTCDFTLSEQAYSESSSSNSPTKSPKKPRNPTKKFKADLNRNSGNLNSFISGSKTEYKVKNPLPDVFCGVKLILPTTLSDSDHEKLKRYYIAYGGELLEEHEKTKATHIIKTDNSDSTKKNGGTYVDLDWLWKSIKRQSLQPCA